MSNLVYLAAIIGYLIGRKYPSAEETHDFAVKLSEYATAGGDKDVV